MRSSGEKKVRGLSLKPGQRNVEVHPDLHLSSVFDTFPEQQENIVRVFDEEGRLTTREIGVKRFHFARLSIFYALRSLSWGVLITYSILMYVTILFLSSALYLGWSTMCGAGEGMSLTEALYFSVVSLAANGGYIGEQPDTMVQPGHICFTGRTVIVMMLSYANIIFVGMVAALVVSKAEYSGRLGQRVVFSDFCSLTAVPGRPDRCWRLTFRMANSIGENPLAHGRLRVFIITAEPLKDYRLRRKEMSRMYYGKLLDKHRHHHHSQQEKGEVSDRGRGNSSSSYLTLDRLQELQSTKKGANMSFVSQMDPALAAAFSEKLTREQRGRQSSGKPKHRRHQGKLSSRNVDDNAENTSRTRGRGTSQREGETSAEATMVQIGEIPQRESESEHDVTNKGTKEVEKQQRKQRVRISAAPDTVVQSHDPPSGGNPSSSSSSDTSTVSIKTNPSEGSRLAAEKAAAANSGDADDFERVCIRVEEVRWTCSEERYLEAREGQLSLWFPVNITHTIDRQSPLYRYIEGNREENPFMSSTPLTSPRGGKTLAGKKGDSMRSFQLVATFDATEMESGATITAKRTYTMSDIVAHYRFSNKMVRMKPDSNEVRIDYHYFNEMLPITAVESSTTESDASHD
ncbi:uncharacterized protein TM35_000311920 [Trypanosoma theileri]|uniref:Uncharacterized protein n=1 Tax=Trypanosoma theileri TaxID=67003 RepID=A0A1X0NMR1_9TRYP|nr:uncharacterized protein TM35_000311920 [Trypanosoma theileri]ORC86006.1 hypothetical protein TM35_000311920 [Trypanosoma theileri]